MIDLAIEKSAYDLSVKDGMFQTVISGDEVAQRLRIHLQRYLSEWFLNTTLGVPYYEKLLGTKDKTIIELYLRKEIGTVYGVERINAFEIVQSYALRSITVNIKVTTIYGDDAEISVEVL